MDQKHVEQKILQLKNNTFPKICVKGLYLNTDYNLTLLTKEADKNKKIIQLLAQWRKKHELWFPNQFPVTEVQTKEWFKSKVLAVSDRLLFLLSIHGRYIGHVGLFRFDWERDSCEIDNIVRGEADVPGIMQHAVSTMMQWGKRTFGIKTYSLQTTSDNQKALNLYARLGFAQTKQIPLVYAKTSEGGEWTEAPRWYSGNIRRYAVYMSL